MMKLKINALAYLISPLASRGCPYRYKRLNGESLRPPSETINALVYSFGIPPSISMTKKFNSYSFSREMILTKSPPSHAESIRGKFSLLLPLGTKLELMRDRFFLWLLKRKSCSRLPNTKMFLWDSKEKTTRPIFCKQIPSYRRIFESTQRWRWSEITSLYYHRHNEVENVESIRGCVAPGIKEC